MRLSLFQVGRETPEGYGLQPAKYSGVKIATWPYTYMEKQRVIQLAKKAFDELGYPEDADERAELDRKEAEVMSGGSSASENVQTPPPIPSSVPAPAPTPIHLPSAGLAPAPTPTPPILINRYFFPQIRKCLYVTEMVSESGINYLPLKAAPGLPFLLLPVFLCLYCTTCKTARHDYVLPATH